jgi:hypothetical protein
VARRRVEREEKHNGDVLEGEEEVFAVGGERERVPDGVGQCDAV